MPNTLLIFGGSGFIGQKICQKAIEQGYHVYSISTHGKPSINEKWVHHANMTWIASDVVKHDTWQNNIPNSIHYCINLIGILKQTTKQTYVNSIIKPNDIISNWATTKQIPYLFLSAKFGPLGYIKAKKEAESLIISQDNQNTIVYSGLVTDKNHLLKQTQGVLLKLGAKTPVLSHWCKQVYPIDVNHLACAILNVVKSPSKTSKYVDLTQ
ncbi:NAD-dependent epimerase/dehydratase family protein [Vagococcus sp. CY53-2]|uniref:NAD-dependent epimerase/dehydratase family protein n=1 Tax=Vagococcus sp. CY53-2 TaxID=2925780 RepID=UPI001F5086BB|nr:NAD-dependent epimerase/dehydratase family protein [Vagococcus sp. CY53-2]MCI0130869.1 NAD-dependent epimerase/dehydratase family protein [Vagococcus sp. CY53-2]